MVQYISKSAVLAEIENKFEKYWKRGEKSDALQDGNAKYWGGVLSCLNEIKTLINTLEVKEMDLEKEIEKYLSTYWPKEKELHPFLGHMAKHFFELGLKTKKED